MCKRRKTMADKEYIEREFVIERLQKRFNDPNYWHTGEDWKAGLSMAKDVVDETPASDVVEVRHGEWKPTNIPSYFGGVIYECSLCGAKDGDHSSILGNYCWRCGAKMDGGRK
jgi:hypothetical protein